MKPKQTTFSKYTGAIEPETSYLCRSDNNILKVESITKPNTIWMVNLSYTKSQTKKDQTVSIVAFDFEKDVAGGKFVQL